MFSGLRKAVIFRVFASEGEPARKFAKNKRGRTENSGGKFAGYLKTVSALIGLFPAESCAADSLLKPPFPVETCRC